MAAAKRTGELYAGEIGASNDEDKQSKSCDEPVDPAGVVADVGGSERYDADALAAVVYRIFLCEPRR